MMPVQDLTTYCRLHYVELVKVSEHFTNRRLRQPNLQLFHYVAVYSFLPDLAKEPAFLDNETS